MSNLYQNTRWIFHSPVEYITRICLISRVFVEQWNVQRRSTIEFDTLAYCLNENKLQIATFSQIFIYFHYLFMTAAIELYSKKKALNCTLHAFLSPIFVYSGDDFVSFLKMIDCLLWWKNWCILKPGGSCHTWCNQKKEEE